MLAGAWRCDRVLMPSVPPQLVPPAVSTELRLFAEPKLVGEMTDVQTPPFFSIVSFLEWLTAVLVMSSFVVLWSYFPPPPIPRS